MLTETQLHRAARLVREAADDVTGDVVPQALLDGLAEVVPGAMVCWSELDLRARSALTFQQSRVVLDETGDPDDEAVFWSVYGELTPCHHLYGSGRAREDVVRISDFIPDRTLLRSRLYNEYLRPWGERYSMFVPLPTLPGRTRVLVFSRSDHDFADVECDLLTLLQPHLDAVYRSDQQRRAGLAPLTVRQWQVLRCLAQGQSTEEVAATMVVSTSTVRKHLENIYQRLEVTSRAAAIAVAFGAGSRGSFLP